MMFRSVKPGLKVSLNDNIWVAGPFCSIDRIAGYLLRIMVCCFVLTLVISSLGCNTTTPPYTYTDEDNRFTFKYPEYWRLVIFNPNYLRLQRIESGSAETDIRIVACDLPNDLDAVAFLENLLKEQHVCQVLPQGEMIITQQPTAMYHNDYEGATAKVTLNVMFEFPIGAEGQEFFVQDQVDIWAIKKENLLIVIYVFASPEEYHEEQKGIIDSFAFQ